MPLSFFLFSALSLMYCWKMSFSSGVHWSRLLGRKEATEKPLMTSGVGAADDNVPAITMKTGDGVV